MLVQKIFSQALFLIFSSYHSRFGAIILFFALVQHFAINHRRCDFCISIYQCHHSFHSSSYPFRASHERFETFRLLRLLMEQRYMYSFFSIFNYLSVYIVLSLYKIMTIISVSFLFYNKWFCYFCYLETC